MKESAKHAPPWKKKRPRKVARNRLTPQEKAEARARAEKAGRRYPNLIDNMAVIRERKKTAPDHFSKP